MKTSRGSHRESAIAPTGPPKKPIAITRCTPRCVEFICRVLWRSLARAVVRASAATMPESRIIIPRVICIISRLFNYAQYETIYVYYIFAFIRAYLW